MDVASDRELEEMGTGWENKVFGQPIEYDIEGMAKKYNWKFKDNKYKIPPPIVPKY